MKTFPVQEFAEAQEYRPQIERFITDQIYIVETMADYGELPPSVVAMRELLSQIG